MKRKTLAFLFSLCLLAAVQQESMAQGTMPAVKVEALKNMVALNPFKLSPEQAKSFDFSKGKGLYFEDGTVLTTDQFIQYSSRPEKDYVMVPYANAGDTSKIVAMLVRKASNDEQTQLKGVVAAMEKKKNYASEFPAADDPEAMKAIQFDPNLKAADFLKGLKKMDRKTAGATAINMGRVALFDEKGDLVPLLGTDGKMNPLVRKYQRSTSYADDYYIDEEEVIRAIVYRKATMEERKANGSGEEKIGIVEESAGVDDSGGGGEFSASAKLLQPGSAAGNKSGNMEGVKLLTNTEKPKGEKRKPFNFNAPDMNGNNVELAAFEGEKVVVLNFWFIQCKPCVAEMPELNKLAEQYKNNKNVEFISICLNKKEEVAKFFESTEFKYRCIPDAQLIAGKYAVTAFPTHIVIDKKGQVVLRQTSYSDDLVANIKAEIDRGSK
ncbi:TlpA family protein disulfide reductase [Chitinophaga eiseniae]|uniref:TlpA family protein disulfide reductase n=1 Tax=Chitinophaga eiseniae TaxID=634771 RepID=A0A847S568_9BACT|nr:TlpA disulfide reductase family protein [Chitinophaga eiseniae]NLR78410.1 TlpA family protein disulfide reductase [Chitinophaga eiseniae]